MMGRTEPISPLTEEPARLTRTRAKMAVKMRRTSFDTHMRLVEV